MGAPLRDAVAGGSPVLDRIESVTLSSVILPMATAVKDAKVLTGRQRAMTEVAFLFAEIRTEAGLEGVGFSYCIRAGGRRSSRTPARSPRPIGEDPNDIARLWTKLVWAGASVGRSGASTQAIAAFDTALWDLKAKRAACRWRSCSARTATPSLLQHRRRLPAHADRAGAGERERVPGLRHRRREDQGRPARLAEDLRRVRAVREHLGDDVPLMVDANQQDRPTAMRVGRRLEEFGLVWLEEPLDVADAEGHGPAAWSLDTAIATGEMLTSVAELAEFIRLGAVDILQPDAPGSAASTVPEAGRARRAPQPADGAALR